MKLIEQIFSVKNECKNNKKHKIVRIFGIKFKFRINPNTNEELTIIKKNQEQILKYLTKLANKSMMPDNIWQINNTKFYLPNYPKDLVQSTIVEQNRYYEEAILKSLDKYIPQNATILDLGANIGNHTLYWLLSSPQKVRKVYSFEPIKTTFDILKKNIELNNLENKVILYNVGLYNKPVEACISSYDMNNIGGTSLTEGEGGILLKRLDDIELNETSIDFIKVDVENLELELLEGAKNTLTKHKPIIFLESWPKYFPAVNQFLETCGYELIERYPSHNYLYKYKKA